MRRGGAGGGRVCRSAARPPPSAARCPQAARRARRRSRSGFATSSPAAPARRARQRRDRQGNSTRRLSSLRDSGDVVSPRHPLRIEHPPPRSALCRAESGLWRGGLPVWAPALSVPDVQPPRSRCATASASKSAPRPSTRAPGTDRGCGPYENFRRIVRTQSYAER